MINAIFFYRISRWCYLHKIPFIPKLITLLIFLVYNSKVPYQAKIGKGTKLGYGGIGVVIHKDSVIGNNCDNVEVGANAVVCKPVPDNAVVAGVPAKILRLKNENS